MTYTIRVTNITAVTQTGISVNDAVPAGSARSTQLSFAP